MPERLVLIGADEPGLNAAQRYMADHPETEALVLYPEENPLPEFVCSAIERHLQNGMTISEEVRAFAIDRQSKQVMVRDVITAKESAISYDKLIFSTGAAPGDLGIPGEHYRGIVRVGTYDDAKRLRTIDGKTVVIGSGMNLLLAISTLMRQATSPIEIVIPTGNTEHAPLSADLTAMVCHHVEQSGTIIHHDQRLERITRGETGFLVHTHEGTFTADRIINATASQPVTNLVAPTGIEMTENGAIVVDTKLRSSDPAIHACGACAAFATPSCSQPIPGLAVRSTERRQAHILSTVLAGHDAELDVRPGAYSLEFGDLAIAGTGMTVTTAEKCGFRPMSATVVQFDRAHFMPGVELMTLELVFDAPTRRILGIQGLGKSGDALRGRISAVSALLPSQPTIEDISNLEVAYSPPFASAMDVLNAVANVADNMLAGINEGISATDFEKLWAERENGEHFFLDCRELGNAQPFLDRHPLHWNHIPQGEIARRIDEIPGDRKIVLICNTGARSYEAQVSLKHAGRKDVVNVDGGMAAVRQSGIDV